MNQQYTPFGTSADDSLHDREENVLLGTLGALLFALAGGVCYIVLYYLGFISSVSALVGVFCAIKGYALFAKKETKRGIAIAVVMAALVIILAWYTCVCLDMVEIYKIWYEAGEVDYVPSVLECLPLGMYMLIDYPAYFLDLLWSALFGGFVCWSYISNRTKREAAIAAQQQAQARTQMLAEQQAAQAAEAKAREDAERAAAEDPVAKAKAFYDSLGNEDATTDTEDAAEDTDHE